VWRRSGKGQLAGRHNVEFPYLHQTASGVLLEPITAVVAALSSGATFVLKGVATEAIKSAYAALNARIQKLYPAAHVSVAQLEQQPASKARQAVLSEDLERVGAATDPELVQLAQAVVMLIQQSPEVARSIGVDVGALQNAKVEFQEVLAREGGTGVKIDTVTGGELKFGKVTAGTEHGDTPKKT
jgi:hypothetical protein